MKPLIQTRMGFPDGNCLPTCLAAMLNYDNPEDFLQIQLWYEIPGVYWMAELQKYLILKHGLMIFNLDRVVPGMLYLRGVRTEKGIDHQTIWCDNELLHDPNPNKLAIWKDGSIHPYDQQFLAFATERTFGYAFDVLFKSVLEFNQFWNHDQSTGPFVFSDEQVKRMESHAKEAYAEWEKNEVIQPEIA